MPLFLSSGIGSFAGSLIGGAKPKDALRNAVLAGGMAGLGNMAFGQGGFGGNGPNGPPAQPTNAGYGDPGGQAAGAGGGGGGGGAPYPYTVNGGDGGNGAILIRYRATL